MTLYLIRHAAAGRKSHRPDDQLRPLDDYGRRQAEQIEAVLRKEPLTRILASPALRCVQTVEPLARSTGIEIEMTDSLFEGTSTAEVLALVLELSDSDAALCSHGDIIPEVVRALERGGTTISGYRGWAKGSIWQLELGGPHPSAVYRPIKVPAPAQSSS